MTTTHILEEFFENELVKKFELMLENNEEFYFDTEEMEEIIIHYLEMGDVEFAEHAVNFALKIHPNSQEIKIKKLEVFLELENYPEAKKLIAELKDSSGDDLDFLVCCAKYYSSLGNSRRAVEFCEKALQYEEEENFLHNFIGDEFVNLDEPLTALAHYKLALNFDPTDDYALENCMICYQKINKSAEALEFINSFLDQYPFSESAWYEYAQYYFNKKKYREAIKGFDYLLAINSTSLAVYSNKAACFEALKEWERAIEVYKEMLSLEFTKAYTYYRIGLCYKYLKNSEQAMIFFQNSLREDPQFFLAMMEQSYLYEEMGEMYEALFFAKKAFSYNEEDLDYHKRLAFLYAEGGNFQESISCLEKIVNKEPKVFYNWHAYIELLIFTSQFEKAQTVIENALKIHNKAELYYQQSHCFMKLGKNIEAQESLEKALLLNPKIIEAMSSKISGDSSAEKEKRSEK